MVSWHPGEDHETPRHPFWRIPRRAAKQLRWPLCAECGRGIVPALAIGFRGDHYHPDCVARLLEHDVPEAA